MGSVLIRMSPELVRYLNLNYAELLKSAKEAHEEQVRRSTLNSFYVTQASIRSREKLCSDLHEVAEMALNDAVSGFDRKRADTRFWLIAYQSKPQARELLVSLIQKQLEEAQV